MIDVFKIGYNSSTLLISAKEIVKRLHRYNSKDYDYNQEFSLFAKFNSIKKSIEIYDMQTPKLIASIPFPYNLNPDDSKLTFEMGDELKFSVCKKLLIITTILASEDCIFPKIVYTVPEFKLVNFLFPECNEIIFRENNLFVFVDDSLSRYSNLPFLPEWDIEKEITLNSFETYQIHNTNEPDIICQDLLN
jgi:hypothetical protein